MKISNCRAFSLFYGEKESDHEGTWTLNLQIRSRKPYPLGDAASHMNANIFNALHFGKKENNFLVDIYVWIYKIDIDITLSMRCSRAFSAFEIKGRVSWWVCFFFLCGFWLRVSQVVKLSRRWQLPKMLNLRKFVRYKIKMSLLRNCLAFDSKQTEDNLKRLI